MNVENLQRMADYIRTIPQDMFDMSIYRRFENLTEIECNSVGCVIGHCVHLEPSFVELNNNGYIDFIAWSDKFTGLGAFSVEDPWVWCFSSTWARTDNTPAGAAARIEWLINNGLPEDWEGQMSGSVPLCYMNEEPSVFEDTANTIQHG